MMWFPRPRGFWVGCALGASFAVCNSCAGYQLKPKIGATYRAEEFSNAGTGVIADDYSGWLWGVWFEYEPPVRLSEATLARLERSLMQLPRAPAPTQPIILADGPEESEVGEVLDRAKDFDFTWPSVAGLVVIAWIIREWKRKPAAPETTSAS